MKVHDAMPMVADGVCPANFPADGSRTARTAWAVATPVWSRLRAEQGFPAGAVPLSVRPMAHGRPEIWDGLSDLYGGDACIAVGLTVAVMVGPADGGEYADQSAFAWLAVNADGTRGGIMDSAKAAVDDEAAALAAVRRDQGYGPAAEFPG